MRLLPFLTISLLTASCASNPALVATAPSVKIEVPVAVKCVTPAELPTVPKSRMPAKGDVKQNAAGAAADVLALELYADHADAILRACAGEGASNGR